MQCTLSSEVHSVHNILPVSETKKIRKDACVGGSTHVPTSDKNIQVVERKDFEMQTEINIEQSEAYDPARLAAFLAAQYPLIAEQLEANIVSTAFDGYDASINSNGDDFLHFSTIVDDDLLDSLRSHQSSSTSSKNVSSARLSSLSAAAVSWSCNGAYVACAYGALDHPGWCNHKAKLQVWNVLRSRRVPPALPDQLTVPVANFAQEASIPLPCCALDVLFHPSIPSLLAVALASGEVRVVDLSPQKGCPMEGYTEEQASSGVGVVESADDEYADDYDEYDDDFDEGGASPSPPPPTATPNNTVQTANETSIGQLSMCSPVGDYWHRDTVRRLAWVRSHATTTVENPYQQFLLVSAGLDGKVLAWRLDSQLSHYADSALIVRGGQYRGHGARAVDVDQLPELDWLSGDGADGTGMGFTATQLRSLGAGHGGDTTDDLSMGLGTGIGVGVDVPSVGITALACPLPITRNALSSTIGGAYNAPSPDSGAEDTSTAHPYHILVGTEGGGVLACVLRGLTAPRVGARRLGGHSYSSEAAQIVSIAPLRHQHDIQKLVDESNFPSSRTITPTDLFKILRSGPHSVRGQPVWSLLSPSPITTVYQSHSAPVTALAFSPFNPRLFASCSHDGYFRLYHTESQYPVLDLQPTITEGNTPRESNGKAVSLQALAWSPVKPTVVVLADDRANIFVYNLAENTYNPVLVDRIDALSRDTNECVSSLQFCPTDPSLLTIASQSGAIHLIQLGPQYSSYAMEDSFFLSSIAGE